ncbi:MAG TPA: chromate efflux transporter [Crocinitomicaceae bacterium]|nr:chromate efflux transporter [Crocinitomicaceae bacterium]
MDKKKLKEVASVFFKMGLIAFGGPAAHIAMMEQEIVEKRKWITPEHFLDLIGATNLIPGPNSTEMTMHCGHERAGFAGLFVAGMAFIFPAVVITGFLAYLYVHFGKLPEVENFIYGIKPAVIAIIAAAILKLGKKALKSVELGILGALTILVGFLGVNEVNALLGAGIIGALYFYFKNKVMDARPDKKAFLPFLILQTTIAGVTKMSAFKVFWIFLKVGSILYGSGYVLFAFLDGELVGTGLLTRTELMDAIAVGQFTPGPVLSTATFIGYQLFGFWGAIAATIGIFLPSFIFVLILNPLIPKMRKSKFLSAFLDAVNIAAVAIMLKVLIEMGFEAVIDWRTALILAISFAFTFGWKKSNAMITVLLGSILGWGLSFI